MKGYLTSFSKYAKIITFVVLMVFVGTLVLGITVAPQLGAETGGCIFDSSQECIGVSEHLLQWQSTFIVSPEQNIFVLLNLVLTALSLFIFVTRPIDKHYSLIEIAQRLAKKCSQTFRHATVKLFDYYRYFLSAGILNPKLFNSKVYPVSLLRG